MMEHTPVNPKPRLQCISFAIADEGSAEPVKASKKAKKAPPVSEDVADIASVGDANLARSGKKIIKALYKEHKEVAALSEEKVCEDKTSVNRMCSGMKMSITSASSCCF